MKTWMKFFSRKLPESAQSLSRAWGWGAAILYGISNYIIKSAYNDHLFENEKHTWSLKTGFCLFG